MVLSDGSIRIMIDQGLLITNPEDIENSIQPASYDIHLGTQFMRPVPNKYGFLDLKEGIEYENLPTYVENDEEYTFIEPHSFILAVTKEVFKLPSDVTGMVEGRSSIGRSGLFIQNAGLADSGFEGSITLELFNATDYPIKVYPGMRIGQMVFYKNDFPSENPYNGKYQGQIDVTGSRINKDFEK